MILALVGMGLPAAADEIRDRQWHLDFLSVTKAHQITKGDGVTVAVVDTGVQADHPDLKGNVLPGYNIDTGGDGRADEDGHGTRMANVIAGHGHGSDDGVLGIAPEAKILPVSIGGTTANPSQIAEGVRWAADHGAQVINMSIEAVGKDAELLDAVTYAQSKGVVLVASAGNSFDGDYVVGPPASYPGVIAVSAVDRSGRFAPDVSVQGEPVGLAAPGKDIASSDAKGLVLGTGTSDSTAIVSGAAALVRAQYPNLDAANVINRLVKTADDKGPDGRDPQYGLGIVNPVKALNADVPQVDANPLGSLANEPAQPTNPPSNPPAHTPTTQAAPGDDRDGTNTALLIAATAVGVIALAVVAISAAVLLRNRRRPAAGPGQPPGPSPYPPPGPPGPPHQPPPHPGPPSPPRP